MKIELEDEEKQFVVELIGPALASLVAALMGRNEMDFTEEHSDAVTDAVCDFICDYYSKG